MRVLRHYCYHVISSRVQDSWFVFKSKWPLGGVRGQHQYCTFRRFCYAYIHHPVTSQKTSASRGMQPEKDKYAPANSSYATLKWSYALRPDPSLLTSSLRHYVPLSVCDRCMGEEQITLVCPQTHLLFNLLIGCWDRAGKRRNRPEDDKKSFDLPLGFFFLHTFFCFGHCSFAIVLQPLRHKEMSSFQLVLWSLFVLARLSFLTLSVLGYTPHFSFSLLNHSFCNFFPTD